MPTPEEQAALDAAKTAQDAADAEAAQAAAEAERIAAEKAAKDSLSADELRAMLDKSNKDRTSANKEAIAAKKRADAAEAKVKAAEDAKKDDLQKAVERADAAEKESAEAKAEALNLKRTTFAQDAGVLAKYRDYAVTKLTSAAKKDPEIDPEEFFKTFKEDHPAMFNGKGGAHVTAKGGAGSPTTPKKFDIEIADHEEAIKTERDPHQLKALKRSLRFMRAEQAKGV